MVANGGDNASVSARMLKDWYKRREDNGCRRPPSPQVSLRRVMITILGLVPRSMTPALWVCGYNKEADRNVAHNF